MEFPSLLFIAFSYSVGSKGVKKKLNLMRNGGKSWGLLGDEVIKVGYGNCPHRTDPNIRQRIATIEADFMI